MGKQRSLAADYAVYLLVRAVICVIQGLSIHAARALAAGLAWFVYHADKRHREVACKNLQHAFPGQYTAQERDKLIQSIYRHFCFLLIEIIHFSRRLHANNWRKYLTMGDSQKLVDRLLSDRPLLIVTGHFGNWEMAGYALGLLGFKTYAVARPLDNRFLDAYLLRFRESTGQKVLAKRGDFDRMQSILDGGGVLATLADQDAGQRGLFVDFFGRPASTHKAIALLALEHRVPIIVAGTMRIGEPMRYQVLAEDAIFPEEYEGKADAVRAITQRFTSALERIVRRAPEQYFWLHRRWKHQPVKKLRRAG